MKTILYVECEKCGKENFIDYLLSETDIQSLCSCGHKLSYSLSFSIGEKILEKSKYEFLKNKDYSLSIVFSAMAFESELSNLYFIWRNIANKISDQELEEELRNLGNIKDKIQKVSKLISSLNIEEFVKNDGGLLTNIQNDFPSLDVNNLSETFQKQLFWPRNRILHLGYSEYKEQEARKCFSISLVGLRIFHKMNKRTPITNH